MITSNGVDNIQSSKRDYYLVQIELEREFHRFISEKTSKDMLEAKGEVDRLMLELVELQREEEYAERGWK